MTGRFVTLEGIEGAGKSTIATALRDALAERGIRARVTREPGGTALAERVRALVLERGSEPIDPVAETLLMFAARRLHVTNFIEPVLARGEWVICDRFTDATRAYQGGGRGMPLRFIEQLAAAVHGDTPPALTLLLDLPVPVGLARAKSRQIASDRFEAEDIAFFERVRGAYLQLAAAHPERIVIIDATQPREAVVERGLTAALAISDVR